MAAPASAAEAGADADAVVLFVYFQPGFFKCFATFVLNFSLYFFFIATKHKSQMEQYFKPSCLRRWSAQVKEIFFGF